jgi:hypothetical protein
MCSNGSMTFVPNNLIQVSLYFPDVKGVTLEPRETVHTTDICKGNISVIVILTTLMSEVSDWNSHSCKTKIIAYI